MHMTQHYYLGAKAKLPEGTFGENISRIRNKVIYYDTELDAVSIYVTHLEKEYVPKHLRLPYTAMIDINIAGSLDASDNLSEADKKCADCLYAYIHDVLKKSFSIELFSAWTNEENESILHERTLCADEITPELLFLKDREYVKILRSRTW